MNLWKRIMRSRTVEPSPEVQAAMASAEERYQHADAFASKMERETAPIREALKRNGFEDAILATFMRRPTGGPV